MRGPGGAAPRSDGTGRGGGGENRPARQLAAARASRPSNRDDGLLQRVLGIVPAALDARRRPPQPPASATETPSGVHPRICCRTRSIFHGGIPSSRARSAGRPPRADDSFPMARTPCAKRAGDQHRRDPGRQRPPQRLQRLRGPPLDGPIGHREAGRLGPPRVVPPDDGLVDRPLDVRGRAASRRTPAPADHSRWSRPAPGRPQAWRTARSPGTRSARTPADPPASSSWGRRPPAPPPCARHRAAPCPWPPPACNSTSVISSAGAAQIRLHVLDRVGRQILRIAHDHDLALGEERRTGQLGERAGLQLVRT